MAQYQERGTSQGGVFALAPDQTATATPRVQTGVGPTQVAVDSHQNIYYVDVTSKEVVRVGPDGTSSTFVDPGVDISALAIDSADHVFVVTGGVGQESVEEYDTTGARLGTVASPFTNVGGMAVDAQDDLYVADSVPLGNNQYSGSVTRIEPDGTVSAFADDLTGASGHGALGALAVAPGGHLYVVRQEGGIDEVAPGTSNDDAILTLPGASGLATTPQGDVYASSITTDEVVHVDPVAHTATQLLSLSLPYGLAVAGKQPQQVSITSTPPTAPHHGDTYTVQTASGGSSSTVGPSASGSCDIQGSVVTFGSPGTCTVVANQAGDGDFLDSPTASQTITIEKKSQSVAISSTPTSVKPGDTYSVTTTGDTNAAVISTSGSCTNNGAQVTFRHPGTCTVTAVRPGDDEYTSASDVQQLTVTARSQSVTFDPSSPTSGVVGQSSSLAATGGGSDNPVVFSVDSGTTNGACTVAGTTVTFVHPGGCVVAAHQDADAAGDYLAGTATLTVPVAKAATSLVLTTSASGAQATVTVDQPGSGHPTGTVQFSLGGQTFGDPVTVQDGVAALDRPVPTGQAAHLSATYSGNDDFTGQSASITRNDPVMRATLTSTQPPSASGWYRGPVTVTFSCTTTGSALTATCPAPVTLAQDGAGQSVTRTVHAEDGGAATTSVSVDIDTTAPALPTMSAREDRAYFVHPPVPTCTSGDATSGGVTCVVTTTRSGSTLSYVATATDAAGNTAVRTGSYQVLGFVLQGATYAGGRFEVHRGSRVTLVAVSDSSVPPRLRGPGRYRPGRLGRAFRAANDVGGHHTWVLSWRTHGLGRHSNWVLGVQTGSTVHRIPIRVVG